MKNLILTLAFIMTCCITFAKTSTNIALIKNSIQKSSFKLLKKTQAIPITESKVVLLECILTAQVFGEVTESECADGSTGFYIYTGFVYLLNCWPILELAWVTDLHCDAVTGYGCD